MNEGVITKLYLFLRDGILDQEILHIKNELYNKKVLNFILLMEREYRSHPELEQNIQSLNRVQLFNVATAPHVNKMLSMRKIDSEIIMQMALGERERTNGNFQQDNLWSPLGDRNFAISDGHITDLPLDFDSPWMAPDQMKTAQIFSRDKQKQLVNEINAAMAYAREVVPEIYSFILEFTKVVQIRKENRTFQFSSLDWIGKIYLGSPELGQNPIYWLDILYHESIHNCLYLIEEFEHLFADQTPMVRPKPHTWVTSPWSGNSIEVHSYSHAALVWYGLWSMTRRLSHTGEFERSRSYLQSQCAFGFRKNGSLTSLFTAEQEQCLTPGFQKVMHAMQKDVLTVEEH